MNTKTPPVAPPLPFSLPAGYEAKLAAYGSPPTGYRFLKIEPTPSPKRVLKIERCGAERFLGESFVVPIRVTEQSHRGENFSPTGGDSFTASNGVEIASRDYPSSSVANEDFLAVRGREEKEDAAVLIVTRPEFTKIQAAVAEYNAYVAAPKILKTVAFKYLGGSARGYRVVDVTFEDSTHIKGLDKSLNAPRTYLKSKIEGKILEVRT